MIDSGKQNEHLNISSILELGQDKIEELLKAWMHRNANEAEVLYKLCKLHGLLDSQDFINWQDDLNRISVLY